MADQEPARKRRGGKRQKVTLIIGKTGERLALSPKAGRTSHSSFRRLRQLHGDEVFFGIEIVFARLVNDANLMELGRSFIRHDLIELP
jgi:hypothetical protein